MANFQDTEPLQDVKGNHETQESEGGETDLHKYLISCIKNPHHTQFIPIEKFSLQDLPEGHRDKDLYKYIKAVANLTVRVCVKITSPHRPMFWPMTNNPYPFCNKRGKVSLKTGSGMMYNVRKFTNGVRQYGGNQGRSYTKCWCRKCELSASPSNIWWEFDVYTATHVVFDGIEANHTSLRLFYDSDKSLKVTIERVRIDDALVVYDRCRMKGATCDESLGVQLEKMWKHYQDMGKKVVNQSTKSRDVDKLTFIVSHPHGFYKQVSVGRWKNVIELDESQFVKKISYTTCTCPGSSGANVHCLGYSGGRYRQLVHSGCDQDGLNTSGAGWIK